jgi:outer membrane biosynthesis protein TonB
MADINKIIDELLLELSVTYPFPNMKDREQVFALLEICDELGYGHLKPVLEEMFINEAEKEGESKLFPGKFHLGGGFYSGKSGGEAELKNDKGNLRAVTPDEKAKFDAKSGKSPSADKPTDTPKPNQPSPETPSAEQPKAAPDKAEAPAPMKQTPVVKTPADVLKSKVEKWSEKEKEFFKKGEDKPGSPTRRSFGEALKDIV